MIIMIMIILSGLAVGLRREDRRRPPKALEVSLSWIITITY